MHILESMQIENQENSQSSEALDQAKVEKEFSLQVRSAESRKLIG